MRDQHRVRQAARRILLDVGDIQPEFPAVTHRRLDGRRGVPDNDPDIRYSGIPDGLKAVEENGLIGYRE